jgi:hypothetical protein
MQDVTKGLKKAELQSVVIVECIYAMEKFYEIPKNEIVDKLSRIINIKGIVNEEITLKRRKSWRKKSHTDDLMEKNAMPTTPARLPLKPPRAS